MKELSTPNILHTIYVQREIAATTKRKEHEQKARKISRTSKGRIKKKGELN